MIELATSPCFHPPGQDVPRHMCIWERTIWVRGPEGWVRVDYPRSLHKVRAWLELCDTWDDVLTLSPDLSLAFV